MLKTKTSYLLIALNLNLLPPDLLLHGTGESVESISLQSEIDSQIAVRIVHNLAEHCTIVDWRSLFGRQIGMTSHGPVGFATLSAPTLGAAIETFVTFEPIQSQMFLGQIIENHDHYQLRLTDVINDEVFSQFLFEVFAKAIESLIAHLVGNCADLAVKIEFANHLTDRAVQLVSEFDSELSFGCEVNSLLIPKICWQLPSPLADAEVYKLNLAKCRHKLESSQSIDVQVNQIIADHFTEVVSQSSSLSLPPSLGEIAEQLHLTERTLIRKLKAKNTSYKELLAANRKSFAADLLRESTLFIADIALLLGYKEVANFCRSFKLWFGQTPSEYRFKKGP